MRLVEALLAGWRGVIRALPSHQGTGRRRVVRVSAHDATEPDMDTATIAVSVRSEAGAIVGADLAESELQLCVADAAWHQRE